MRWAFLLYAAVATALIWVFDLEPIGGVSGAPGGGGAEAPDVPIDGVDAVTPPKPGETRRGTGENGWYPPAPYPGGSWERPTTWAPDRGGYFWTLWTLWTWVPEGTYTVV